MVGFQDMRVGGAHGAAPHDDFHVGRTVGIARVARAVAHRQCIVQMQHTPAAGT